MNGGEKMKSRFSQWIKRIRDTQVDEIDCSACLDQISRYVDLELSGVDAAEQLPRVEQHLNQCGICQEEYLLLRDLAQMEQENRPPLPDDLKNQIK
jgi:predicted anti-sigma-YlaC factor YlaD